MLITPYMQVDSRWIASCKVNTRIILPLEDMERSMCGKHEIFGGARETASFVEFVFSEHFISDSREDRAQGCRPHCSRERERGAPFDSVNPPVLRGLSFCKRACRPTSDAVRTLLVRTQLLAVAGCSSPTTAVSIVQPTSLRVSTSNGAALGAASVLGSQTPYLRADARRSRQGPPPFPSPLTHCTKLSSGMASHISAGGIHTVRVI